MMMFEVMMMEATTICAMEMMTRLFTTMLAVMRSMVLSIDKTTIFAKRLDKCSHETGRIAIIHSKSMKTLIIRLLLKAKVLLRHMKIRPLAKCSLSTYNVRHLM
jgi:hypothetical protein